MRWQALPALTGIEKVDKLAITATFQGKEQLLGVPEIPISLEEQQAQAVYQTAEKGGIETKFEHFAVIRPQANQVDIHLVARINIEKNVQ